MPRICYYIDPHQRNPQGFIPSVVTEGEPGFCPLVGSGEHAEPWYWGTDLETAERICAQANVDLGLTPYDVSNIIDSSITQQIRNDAAHETATARYQGRVSANFRARAAGQR